MTVLLNLAALTLQLPLSPARPSFPEVPRLRPVQRWSAIAPQPAIGFPRTLAGSGSSSWSPGPPAVPITPQPVAGPGVDMIDNGVGGHDYGYAVVSDGLGHVYVQGVVQSANGYDDFLTLGFDSQGNELWRRAYDSGAGYHDRAFELALDPSGNVIVAGSGTRVGTGFDITILKYDPQGNLLWSYAYDGPGSGHDDPRGGTLVVDDTGTVFVGGISWGGPATDYDAVLLAVSPGGSLVWERRFDGPTSGFDEYYSVDIDAQGNVLAAGDTHSVGYDFLLHKYDPSGNLLWEQLYDSPGGFDDILYAVSVDPSDNVVVTGLSDSASTHDDYLTVAYDSAGNMLWAQSLDGGSGHSDIPFWVEAGPNGEVAVVGVSQDASLGASGLLALYDSLGNLQWQERVGSGLSWLTDVDFTGSGELLVAGRLDGWSISSTDAMLRRYSPGGDLLDETLFDNPCNAADFLFAISVDPVGDVFGVGYGRGPSGNVDMEFHRFQ